MDTNTLRRWATPLTIGAFILMGITGILMFFEVRLGLIKVAHEWLSWLMVLAVGLHVALHWKSFSRYFSQKSALTIIGVFAVLTMTSMLLPDNGPKRGGPGAPGGASMQMTSMLLEAPLGVVAAVMDETPQALQTKLEQQGIKVANIDTSLKALAQSSQKNPMDMFVPAS